MAEEFCSRNRAAEDHSLVNGLCSCCGNQPINGYCADCNWDYGVQSNPEGASGDATEHGHPAHKEEPSLPADVI